MLKERGSVLMLMPAGILVLIILGSIAVDHGIVFLAQRELENELAGLSNDLSTQALSEDYLYERGGQSIDRARVEQAIASVNVADIPGAYELEIVPTIEGTQITLTGRARIRLVFARAVPGVEHEMEVVATATARPMRR